MKSKTLSYVLRNLKLEKCNVVGNGVYYTKRKVRQMIYDSDYRRNLPCYSKCEFLIIVDNGVKKAIIYNCGDADLHWYVFKKWRNKQVLSNTLRSGIINKIWPNIKSVTCYCDYGDNEEEKRQITQHLASLAGLSVSYEETCWIVN